MASVVDVLRLNNLCNFACYSIYYCLVPYYTVCLYIFFLTASQNRDLSSLTNDTGSREMVPGIILEARMQEVLPILYTIPAAGKASGFCRSRLYALMGDGAIEAVKIGRRTLVKADSLKAYIDGLPAATIRPAKKAP
jgi:hypothetical protein